MSVPGFTADASVYHSRGRYLTGGAARYALTGLDGAIAPAMINTGDGVDCSNCVGGECAELHCFEKWTHGGGGPGGPYEGGGGGGGGGTCSTDVVCHFGCQDSVFYPCYNVCVENAGGDFNSKSFKACKARCDAATKRCSQNCKVC